MVFVSGRKHTTRNVCQVIPSIKVEELPLSLIDSFIVRHPVHYLWLWWWGLISWLVYGLYDNKVNTEMTSITSLMTLSVKFSASWRYWRDCMVAWDKPVHWLYVRELVCEGMSPSVVSIVVVTTKPLGRNVRREVVHSWKCLALVLGLSLLSHSDKRKWFHPHHPHKNAIRHISYNVGSLRLFI